MKTSSTQCCHGRVMAVVSVAILAPVDRIGAQHYC